MPTLAVSFAEQLARSAQATVNQALRRHVPGLEPLPELEIETGCTPKDVIFARDTLRLYHYRPVRDEVYRVPLLFVMSLINRYYIVDLAPQRSLVEHLVNEGFDVYLIDWGTPRYQHRHLRVDDYVTDYLPQCIEKVLEDAGEAEISIIGYCLGGTLAAMYAALNPKGPLKNLACFATPIDADGLVTYRQWTAAPHFDVDALVERLGNVPPEVVTSSIDALRPFQKASSELALLAHADDEDFVRDHLRLAKWAGDQVPFPGEAFRQLVKNFLRDNSLHEGTLVLGGRKVNLARMRCRLLHVVAEHDHIVPRASSSALVVLAGSKSKRELVVKGGHVSLVAGRNAVKRLWPELTTWLEECST